MTTINPSYLPPSFFDPSGNLTVDRSVAEQVSAAVETRIQSMPPAEKEIFLALLQGTSIDALLPSDHTFDGAKLNSTLSNLEAAAAALRELSQMGNDVIDFLARVMIEQAGEQRKSALEDRLQAREAARTNLMDQAGKMEEAAKKMIDGAIAQLVMTVVMAAVQIGFSVASLKMAGNALNANKGMKEIDDLNPSVADQAFNMKLNNQVAGMNAKGGGWGGLGGAAGALGGATGNVANSWAQADAKNIEAEGSRFAAEAEYQKGQADIKKEIQDSLNQLIQSIINFIKELKEAEVNMMQAITRG